MDYWVRGCVWGVNTLELVGVGGRLAVGSLLRAAVASGYQVWRGGDQPWPPCEKTPPAPKNKPPPPHRKSPPHTHTFTQLFFFITQGQTTRRPHKNQPTPAEASTQTASNATDKTAEAEPRPYTYAHQHPLLFCEHPGQEEKKEKNRKSAFEDSHLWASPFRKGRGGGGLCAGRRLCAAGQIFWGRDAPGGGSDHRGNMADGRHKEASRRDQAGSADHTSPSGTPNRREAHLTPAGATRAKPPPTPPHQADPRAQRKYKTRLRRGGESGGANAAPGPFGRAPTIFLGGGRRARRL